MELDLLTQIKAAGLPEPEAEVYILPRRKCRADYAWREPLLVALEIEGGIFGKGRKCPLCGRRAVGAHTSIERLLTDMTKYNECAIAGWLLVRATPSDVASGKALGLIERALRARGWTPEGRDA